MPWDLPHVDTCACCAEPVPEVEETCYVCLRTVCTGCARQDDAGDALCPDCYAAMREFVADCGDVVEEVA